MEQTIEYKKTLTVGRTKVGGACELELELRRKEWGLELSICGSIWNRRKTDGETFGQLREGMRDYVHTWTMPADKFARIVEVWNRWHLNGMLAGCEHQRATWNLDEKIELVSYKLTHEAMRLRDATRQAAADAALLGLPFSPDATDRALAELKDWYSPRYSPPDADSPLSGCYEVDKRETQSATWVYPVQHPRGLLCKPCEVCGYKYGSEWRHETLPDSIIEEIKGW